MNSLFSSPTYCFADGSSQIQELEQGVWKIAPPAVGNGVAINSVSDLLSKIAELRNAHPALRLMFRGQQKDYQIELTHKQTATFLYPSALREACLKKTNVVTVDGQELSLKKYAELLDATVRVFLSTLSSHHPVRPKDQQVTSFEAHGIAQHYKVIPTTMLDVSSDWRVSCCFSQNDGEDSYLYVLGLPDFDEPISIKVHENIAIVDLARVCPPTALRPHFQNGFLISPFPDPEFRFALTHQLTGYPSREWDFTKRLLAKFRLTEEFWRCEMAPKDPIKFYFPDTVDPMFRLANDLRGALGLHAAKPFS